MAGTPTTGEPAAGQATAKRRLTISPKLISVGVIVAAALWFILVNRHKVSIYLWVPKVTAPMWLVLLITFAGGLLTGLLLRRGGRKQKT